MLLVSANELGRDHEHCLLLTRRLDDVDSDMRVDDARFVAVNALAGKILSHGEDVGSVEQQRDALNQKWALLKGGLEQYRLALAGALEVHGFLRDVQVRCTASSGMCGWVAHQGLMV